MDGNTGLCIDSEPITAMYCAVQCHGHLVRRTRLVFKDRRPLIVSQFNLHRDSRFYSPIPIPDSSRNSTQSYFTQEIMSDLKSSLAAQIKGKVLTPEDSSEYLEQSKRWASNAEKKAAYIVLVESAEDISKTVLPYSYS